MPSLIDQIGQKITFNEYPQRIISLVPSITELLFDLGLENRIVGRTSFCIHPISKVKSIRKIGGTKKLRIEDIKSLSPDLIIANKEENVKEQVVALKAICPVYTSDISRVEEAYQMIKDIGALTNTKAEAKELLSLIMKHCPKPRAQKRTLYLIWKSPYMSVGGDTYISNMMSYAGYLNCLLGAKRYPSLTIEEIKALYPEMILLSSEPFPFKQQHVEALQELCPKAKIELVDGELFSWYGSKILKAFQKFSKLDQQ